MAGGSPVERPVPSTVAGVVGGGIFPASAIVDQKKLRRFSFWLFKEIKYYFSHLK